MSAIEPETSEKIAEKVEKRTYSSLKTVSSSEVSTSIDKLSNGQFFNLFRYIKGANSQDMKISMTKPVLIESAPLEGDAVKRTFTMSFFLPSEMQKQDAAPPPSPKEEDKVQLTNRPATTIYSITYDGYSNQDKVNSNARELQKILTEKGLKFNADSLTFAGYDPPFKFFWRRNEVWIEARDD